MKGKLTEKEKVRKEEGQGGKSEGEEKQGREK